MALKFLHKPYPYFGNLKRAVISNFFVGCFVALFLIIFQPFGTAFWETTNKTLKLIGFGAVSFVVPLLVQFSISVLFRRSWLEDRWNIGKEISAILIIICLIALGNIVYGNTLGIMHFTIRSYLGVLIPVCLIGVFPVTLHVFIKHNRFLKMNLELASAINKQIDEHHHIAPQSLSPDEDTVIEPNEKREESKVEIESKQEQIELLAENGKDKLVISLNDLLYIESADNYSNIVFLQEGKYKRQLIRSSLKRIESMIQLGSVLRCHRAYIVNIKNVKHIEGNAAGYRLQMEHGAEEVPVSRTYASLILEKLKAIH